MRPHVTVATFIEHQRVAGEALPQARLRRVNRRVAPMPAPPSRRMFWHRVADLCAVACWTVAGVGVLLLIYTAAG
jgi:hypothetical protein